MHRRDFFRWAAVANVISPALLAGVPSKKASYYGGTLSGVTSSTVGKVHTVEAEAFVFRYQGGELRIPYEQINSLAYGQRAGRRLGLAIAISPVLLLSKKRKHYLTIGFVDDEGRQQAAVFELGKDIVRTTLAGLEARTGRQIEFDDEEARKSSKW
jgi:hypothetical protein